MSGTLSELSNILKITTRRAKDALGAPALAKGEKRRLRVVRRKKNCH